MENNEHSFILTWCWWCSWCPLLPHTALDWCTHVALALESAAAGPKKWAHTHFHFICGHPSSVFELTFIHFFAFCFLNSIAVTSLVSLTYLENDSHSLQWWLIMA